MSTVSQRYWHHDSRWRLLAAVCFGFVVAVIVWFTKVPHTPRCWAGVRPGCRIA